LREFGGDPAEVDISLEAPDGKGSLDDVVTALRKAGVDKDPKDGSPTKKHRGFHSAGGTAILAKEPGKREHRTGGPRFIACEASDGKRETSGDPTPGVKEMEGQQQAGQHEDLLKRHSRFREDERVGNEKQRAGEGELRAEQIFRHPIERQAGNGADHGHEVTDQRCIHGNERHARDQELKRGQLMGFGERVAVEQADHGIAAPRDRSRDDEDDAQQKADREYQQFVFMAREHDQVRRR